MSTHWDRRKSLEYYRVVCDMARQHAAFAKTLLDVGGGECQYLDWYDWVSDKTVIDLVDYSYMTDARYIVGDFMMHSEDYDLVLCLQVLEHLRSPEEFAHRLLDIGRVVVVSVPYRWPKGSCPSHVQDPVTIGKFASWFPKPWLDMEIVREKGDRMVAVWK